MVRIIVNTDLDGIISGMLLQRYMGWEVAGYSSCSGKNTDMLWLKDNLDECVFIDLPVRNYPSIDQHFISFDGEKNKYTTNPNDIRNRSLRDYNKKYPFGTAHFVLAKLEQKMNVTLQNKQIENFDLYDLFLRADRVIGNTNQYTNNCMDWADWLISIGGETTKTIFNIVKSEYKERLKTEKNVENYLTRFNVTIDGDCANLFRMRDINKIQSYFKFLGKCFDLVDLPLYFNEIKLEGYRFPSYFKEICKRKDVFSYAFVTKDTLSITFADFKERIN